MPKVLKNTEVWTHIIAFLIGITLGFLLYAFIVNRTVLSINPQISIQLDPLNLISLLVTTLLAVYVLRRLSKKDEGEKIERELIIKHFTNFESELGERVRRIARGGLEFQYVTAILKRYGMRMQTIIQLANEQGFLIANSEISPILIEKLRGIKILLTNTPKTGDIEDGIRLKDSCLLYSDNQVDKIAKAIFDMNCLIFKLIVEINKAERK